MDHLLHPQNAMFPPLIVRYYNNYAYDGGSFSDYPVRLGFVDSKEDFNLRNFIESARESDEMIPSDDHDSFFQAWFFFGLIHQCLGAHQDWFIDHQDEEQRVTTVWLPLCFYIRIWSLRLLFSESQRVAELKQMDECFQQVRDMMLVLDVSMCRDENISHLSEEVAMSIIVLGSTIDRVKDFFPEEINRAGIKLLTWPVGEFALKRLRAAGLCESEVTRLTNRLTCFGLLFCGSMQRFGTTDHSQCSKDKCAAEDIDEETYETVHVEDCDKKCKHYGPIVSELVSALVEKNSFPVITLEKTKTSEMHVTVQSYCDSMAYTAITHVWADGLGNKNANTLPLCQILRLYQLVHDINQLVSSVNRTNATSMPPSSETITVNLWLDTFCVPIDRDLRNKAITLMYDAYEKANSVLVLDSYLYSISAERHPVELLYRITTSAWMRRAWTFQEGALAKSLFVQFKDKAIHMDAEVRSILDQIDGGQYCLTLLDSYVMIQDIKSCRKTENIDRFVSVLQGLRQRSTSHAKDKLTCLAIMLRCDALMDIEGDLRTKGVYKQLEYLPRIFLWHSQPTLDIPGFRWAPHNIFSIGGDAVDALARSDDGLLVYAEGMVLWGLSAYLTEDVLEASSEASDEILLIRDFTSSKCYKLDFEGYQCRTDAPWIALAVILAPRGMPLICLEPFRTGAVIRLDWDPSMATPQELLDWEPSMITQEVSNYIHRCNPISGEYLCSATFEEMDPSSISEFELDDEYFFEGKVLGPEQKWCVT